MARCFNVICSAAKYIYVYCHAEKNERVLFGENAILEKRLIATKRVSTKTCVCVRDRARFGPCSGRGRERVWNKSMAEK